MNHDELYFYALGYYDGRKHGYERVWPDDDSSRMYYILGFDRGVADYCELDVDSTGE